MLHRRTDRMGGGRSGLHATRSRFRRGNVHRAPRCMDGTGLEPAISCRQSLSPVRDRVSVAFNISRMRSMWIWESFARWEIDEAGLLPLLALMVTSRF